MMSELLSSLLCVSLHLWEIRSTVVIKPCVRMYGSVCERERLIQGERDCHLPVLEARRLNARPALINHNACSWPGFESRWLWILDLVHIGWELMGAVDFTADPPFSGHRCLGLGDCDGEWSQPTHGRFQWEKSWKGLDIVLKRMWYAYWSVHLSQDLEHQCRVSSCQTQCNTMLLFGSRKRSKSKDLYFFKF